MALLAGATIAGDFVGHGCGTCVRTMTVLLLSFGFGSVAELLAEAVLKNEPRTP